MSSNPQGLWGRYRIFVYVLLIVLIAAGTFFTLRVLRGEPGPEHVLPGQPSSTESPGATSTAPGDMGGEEEGGVTIRLSEGQDEPEPVVPVRVLPGEALGEAETTTILARLPDLPQEPDDAEEFRLPEEVVPPPRAGETIEEPFPAPSDIGPETVQTGPLEVLRYAPEGEVPIAPFINVTFNQPMVPVATLEDLSQEDVPVILEPDLPGTWRWLGTKTVNFQFDSDLIDRLPMATQYTVTIPAGTQSATGGELAETVEFTFTTPTPTMTHHLPPSSEPQPLDPLFFVAFDQRIDPEAVLGTISLVADGQKFELKLATQEQIEKDDRVSAAVAGTQPGRWLSFSTQEPLPKDTDVSVVIGPGTPSDEGPLVTQREQRFGFHTYTPLRIVDHGCSWGDPECRPLTPLFIEFNNPLDVESYAEGMLTVVPELPGASVTIYGDTIRIQGATQGRTTYRVTVDAELQDVFGQALGQDTSVRFRIGSAEPVLVGPDQLFVTLDPSDRDPELSLYTINYDRLDVRIYAVEPSDWPAFLKYMYEYQRTDTPPDPPGRLVLDETRRFDVPSDTLTEVPIGLSDLMDGDSGHFIVIARPPRRLFQEERYWEVVHAWVQVTQVGLDAFVDHSEMVVWASALADGTPLSGVTIESGPVTKRFTTDQDGVAKFDIPPGGASYLVATQGDDQALLPSSTHYWSDDGWSRRPLVDELRWYVFDDRGMYRPGEEMHVKGWLRRIGAGQNGDVGLIGAQDAEVRYLAYGPQGNELASGQVDVSELGGFDFVVTLPENANLGYARLELTAVGSLSSLSRSQHYHNFQIQEFRRPEFEVSARNETTGPYFVGGHAVVAVEAKYYTGDPLPSAEVTWRVTSSPSNYQPPNWPEFSFGTWRPWWYYYEDMEEGGGTEVQTYEGFTDATGNHYLRMDFEEAAAPRPVSVVAEATVFDVNRQAWSGTTSLLVHPADHYVGMRTERYFVERGDPLEIEMIVTDLDGNPVVDRPIRVTAGRLEWKFENGEWRRRMVDPQECTVGSEEEPVTCSFETTVGGRYQITATVTDELGRANQSRITRWVSGGQRPPSREVEQEEVTLVPDKETYQPGDVAEILVQPPFSPAEGLLTVTRSGILYTRRFKISEDSIVLKVPIEAKHIPNLNVQVDLTGSAPRTDDQGEVVDGAPPRPAYATGNLTLTIPPLERTLSLDVEPRQTAIEPGGETTVDVALQDEEGKPVPDAELAVVVVDEAILALTNYQLADPISVFYQHRGSDLSSTYSRASIILVDPTQLVEGVGATALPSATMVAGRAVEEAEGMAFAMEAPAEDAMGKGGGGGGAAPEPIRVRLDFNPLATFAPEVRTDENGAASVRVTLPDNLTRYRIMVVAVDSGGSQFGSSEANLTARLPLMVRPSAPRFLNFGDHFELPVVLQNQTDDEMTVGVVLRASNLELIGDQGLRVQVPGHDRVEVRFPVTTVKAGTARFQVAAVSGDHADAASIALPVYTPATTEAFATYGVVDEGSVAQPVAAPDEVFSQFGGLEINTSSTALQALTDAVLYLVAYPFECSEQLASRILGVAALRDVLTAFEAEGLPSPGEMEAAVQRDIERLRALQNWDGGFPYWRRGQDSIPFATIHAAHALQRAKLKGFEVPEEMQERALNYLRDIENHYPYWYSTYTRRTLSAYALHVRNLMGDSDPEKARALYQEAGLEGLSLDAIGWIWQVLVDDPSSASELEDIRRFIGNRVVETPGAANFTTHVHDQTYLLLSSNRRTDGILLDTLILDDPQNDLIPMLVNGLLAHRTKGRWGNTQENVFILLALDRYFNTFEAQTPDFVARIWLGDTYAGEHTYEGRSTERHETNIPMSYLVAEETDGATQDLILSKDGPGRLYYRLGLSYAPTDLKLDALDMGFVVQREYEAVDDPEDVTRDEDGVWHIKAGARVRVRLTMVADNRRYHVALVDPLPAGLEIVNPALAVSQSIPQDPNSPDFRYGWWWWGTWYNHQNMRDERAEAFTPLLWDGVYEYTYVARATTPGTFVVPPAKAEEMYSPEVFGRSASDRVVVE